MFSCIKRMIEVLISCIFVSILVWMARSPALFMATPKLEGSFEIACQEVSLQRSDVKSLQHGRNEPSRLVLVSPLRFQLFPACGTLTAVCSLSWLSWVVKTWNLKMTPWKRGDLFSKLSFSGSHVNFGWNHPGCTSLEVGQCQPRPWLGYQRDIIVAAVALWPGCFSQFHAHRFFHPPATSSSRKSIRPSFHQPK